MINRRQTGVFGLPRRGRGPQDGSGMGTPAPGEKIFPTHCTGHRTVRQRLPPRRKSDRFLDLSIGYHPLPRQSSPDLELFVKNV